MASVGSVEQDNRFDDTSDTVLKNNTARNCHKQYGVLLVVWNTVPGADPGFPRGGADPKGGCQPIILPLFPKTA